jgi:pimeloyl-ACP methyl ester carboxylesterase
MFVLNFARLQPTDVAAVVLLDPTHPRQFAPGGSQWSDHEQALPFFRAGPAIARLGLAREALWASDRLKPLPLPEQTRRAYIAIGSTPKAMGAMKAEAVALYDLCRESTAFPSLGDKPLLVLSAEKSIGEGFPPSLHEEMSRLSSIGERRVIAGASHSGLVVKPEHARTVVAAVQEVVMKLRH